MPIKGLHNTGQVTPGLARAGIIRLGYKAKKCTKCARITTAQDSGPTCPACGSALPDITFPRESAHFVLTDAPGLAETLNDATPTSLNVYFPFDEVERVFPNYMQNWAASALHCRGDGEHIQYAINPQTGRATVKDGLALETFTEGRQTFTAGQVMPCPGLERNLYPKCQHCKPNALLIVMLRDVPRLAYYQISTTSIHNIADLTRQLEYVRQQVAKLTGQPRLTGVPFILRRVERTISAPNLDKKGDAKMVNGKPVPKQRVKKYFLELEIEPEWIVRMVRGLSQLADPLRGPLALPAPVDLPATNTPPQLLTFTDPPTWEPRPDDGSSDGEAEAEDDIIEGETTPAPRPALTPAKLKEILAKKIAASPLKDPETGEPLPVTLHPFGPKTAGLVSKKFQEAFSNQAHAQDMYHLALEWLTGVDSANNLTAAAADAVLDWLLNGGKQQKFAAPVLPPAQAEALAVYTVAGDEASDLAETNEQPLLADWFETPNETTAYNEEYA